MQWWMHFMQRSFTQQATGAPCRRLNNKTGQASQHFLQKGASKALQTVVESVFWPTSLPPCIIFTPPPTTPLLHASVWSVFINDLAQQLQCWGCISHTASSNFSWIIYKVRREKIICGSWRVASVIAGRQRQAARHQKYSEPSVFSP